jgi:hypothetical protein
LALRSLPFGKWCSEEVYPLVRSYFPIGGLPFLGNSVDLAPLDKSGETG